jgi:hypothetical protein
MLLSFGAWLIFEAPAVAHGDHGHKNLKVLDPASHKALDDGMKVLAKGLGVECTACHVKGEFDKDDLPGKEVARRFFTEAVGEHDPSKRAQALAPLLEALKLSAPKDAAKIWAAIDSWKKRPL